VTIHLPTPAHEAFKNDFTDMLRKHQDALTPPEMLAVAAQFTGMLLALQDQQTMSVERAMQIDMKNLEIGNTQIVEDLMQSEGRA